MCGFAGIWRPSGLTRDGCNTVAAMTETLSHRGPDGSGFWADGAGGIALGHRRLAIIDLSDHGRQPMASASGRYHVAYNGEIYNFEAIRQELRGYGTEFRGGSDTEVLLAAIERWGVDAAVPRLTGMFAFALWDAAERALFLVRDRLGEKPLYYGWQGATLLFASELRALQQFPGWRGDLDRGALALYVRHGYVPSPYSIYAGAHKVRPGTMRIARDGPAGAALEEHSYWSARQIAAQGVATPLDASDDELADAADVLLRRTVRREMVADVPLGAFLSGGVDSSLIVALMQAQSDRPVRTFTIGFHEPDLDEAGYARAVARHLGTQHEELYLTPADLLATVPRMAGVYDEPFGDSSQIPTLLVAQIARRQVTVALSGDGGDELFGGYEHYRHTDRLWRRLQRVPLTLRAPISRALGAGAAACAARRIGGDAAHRFWRKAGLIGAGTESEMFRGMMSYCMAPGTIALAAREPGTAFAGGDELPPGNTFLERMMYLDLVSYLPDDVLVKVDRATMSVGLESRAPFLDHDVAAFAWRVPLSAKFRHGQGKWLLRHLLRRYVPPALVDRPKMGFGVPISAWLAGPLRQWAGDLLAPDRLRRAGLFDVSAISRILAAQRRGVRQWDGLLWALLMFESWRDGAASRISRAAAVA